MCRCIIAGSRSITDFNLVSRLIQSVLDDKKLKITEVVSGKAPGVDTLGEEWAKLHGIPIKPFPADWYPNGHFFKGAGIVRNHKMGDYADAAICIWDGISDGTHDMYTYMKKLKKPAFLKRTDQIDLFDMFD